MSTASDEPSWLNTFGWILLTVIGLQTLIVPGLIWASHGFWMALGLFVTALGLITSLLSQRWKPKAMYYTGLILGVVGLSTTLASL